ncbi:hypothetical protein GCM10009834_51030 [Streptomonospora arabica]|uniref:Uncharacterized protein n=1 Tax=Streptomonospora halophila TaxID=427369 RepID=A0ABP9GZR6_9ACTN
MTGEFGLRAGDPPRSATAHLRATLAERADRTGPCELRGARDRGARGPRDGYTVAQGPGGGRARPVS